MVANKQIINGNAAIDFDVYSHIVIEHFGGEECDGRDCQSVRERKRSTALSFHSIHLLHLNHNYKTFISVLSRLQRFIEDADVEQPFAGNKQQQKQKRCFEFIWKEKMFNDYKGDGRNVVPVYVQKMVDRMWRRGEQKTHEHKTHTHTAYDFFLLFFFVCFSVLFCFMCCEQRLISTWIYQTAH